MAAKWLMRRELARNRLMVRAMESVPGNQHTSDETVILALRGLAQGIRLEVLALLAANGHEGLSAGEIAAPLDVSPASLSFHFQHLAQAGPVIFRRRRSRQIIYAPIFRYWLLARLREQWHSPQAGVQEEQHRRTAAELAEDELELVVGGAKVACSDNREYFDIPLILEILDSSTRRLSLS